MLSPRRTLPALALALAVALPFAGTLPANAAYGDAPISTATVIVPMHFPALGPTSYSDTFLACRSGCTRKHFGQDLMGPRMRPLVATFNGYVSSLKRETTVGGGNYITIKGDNGWSANYLHVNNDTPGTDDGRGTASYAFAPGIYVGKRVFQGELLGWSGDSGNAESTAPHLHFELRKGDAWSGTVYNAFASLNHAYHDARPTTAGPHPDGTYVHTCGLCPVYRIEDNQKHYLRKEVAGQIGFDARTVVTVTRNEVNWYPKGVDVPLPPGRAYRDPDGVVWFVADGLRYPLPNPEALAALGIASTRVRSMTLTGLGTVRKAATGALVPTGLVHDGALYRVPDVANEYWYVHDGERHLVTDVETMRSWGLRAEDAITLPVVAPPVDPPVEGTDPTDPVDELVLPPLGSALRLHDGAVIKDGYNHLFFVSNGTRRPFGSAAVYKNYGWTPVLQQTPAAAVQKRLPTGPRLP